VQIGDAIEMKELPFVMGILGDFTGQPEKPLAALKDRKFVEINPDNFDSVLKGMAPHLSYSVANKLSDDPNAGQVKVDLKFEEFEDFSPERVAQQVAPLKSLLELRERLSGLQGSLQGNQALDDLLFAAATNTETKEKLRKELGIGQEENKDE
jgi:type VI secretion system protein ImpB